MKRDCIAATVAGLVGLEWLLHALGHGAHERARLPGSPQPVSPRYRGRSPAQPLCWAAQIGHLHAYIAAETGLAVVPLAQPPPGVQCRAVLCKARCTKPAADAASWLAIEVCLGAGRALGGAGGQESTDGADRNSETSIKTSATFT